MVRPNTTDWVRNESLRKAMKLALSDVITIRIHATKSVARRDSGFAGAEQLTGGTGRSKHGIRVLNSRVVDVTRVETNREPVRRRQVAQINDISAAATSRPANPPYQ